MITLYGAARVPYTEKVRRALLYKRVPFEFHEPTTPEDYQRWNPKSGMLPVIHVGDELIEDSTQILYALDQRYPEPPLLAPDSMVASQQRQLEDWADESFLWYWMKYRRMVAGGELTLPLKGDQLDEPSEVVDEKSGRFRRLRAWVKAGGTWERPITGLQRELGLRMDDLVNFLGARPFFYSDRLSVADLGVYAVLFTMRRDAIPGSARLLAARPNLVAFMARVEEATDRSGGG